MVSPVHRLKQHLCQTHKAMQMQGQSFFANIRIASRGLDPSRGSFIKCPHYCTPALDDVLLKLNGAKYFSIVVAGSGYWNIKLDHPSSLNTTFNSRPQAARGDFQENSHDSSTTNCKNAAQGSEIRRRNQVCTREEHPTG